VNRILLADDSPHAQRMGELILREEGFEVVTVTDGETALVRLRDVDPDLILADVLMPVRSGYEICEYVKGHTRHQHTRVVLTAGALEPFDEGEAKRVKADGILKKPFEASVVLEIVKPLLDAAKSDRGDLPAEPAPPLDTPKFAIIDAEKVRAAVTIALDASMSDMIEKITNNVIIALDTRR
jgi:CheY-like chemotaxis protein